MRYLNYFLALEYLKMGRTLEQWIGHVSQKEYRVIRWLSLAKEKDGKFSCAIFEAFDDGNINFLDIYEFEQVDPDFPEGHIHIFNTPEKALEFAVKISNKRDAFVNPGVIQEEYKTFLEETACYQKN